MTTYTDQQLVSMIQQSGKARKDALRYAYLSWRKLAKGVFIKKGATEVDVEDAISEAVVVLDNHVRTGKYEAVGSLKNYFIGLYAVDCIPISAVHDALIGRQIRKIWMVSNCNNPKL